MMKIAIFLGSQSDREKMKPAAELLKTFHIEFEAYVLSAHRVPEALVKTLKKTEQNGAKVIIAGAGMAAHLPGVIAAHTILPVIGVPLSAKLDGMDALLSIVQMPKSIPVATVGIDNAYNAAMLATQILATSDENVKQKLISYRQVMKENFLTDNGQIQL